MSRSRFSMLLVLVGVQFFCTVLVAAGESLADLAEQRQWSQLRDRLANGAEVDAAQPDGTTALHWAVYHEHVESVSRLIDAKANVDATTRYRVTPLSLACEFGHAEAAAFLLKAGANVEATRAGKETPLMLAARNGNAKLMRSLIAAKATIDAKEVNGQTALMWAAAAGNVEAVDLLIKAGADIDYRLKNPEFSAMTFAARQGRTAVVLRLLDAGADVNRAVKAKRTDERSPRNGMSALMYAVESGHLELALILVERGADPNDQRSGYAPLHAITWVRKTELGDNPKGDPAPRITGNVHSLEFVRRLIALGAEVDLQLKSGSGGRGRLNPKGATPFLLAAKNGDVPLLKLLLEHGANPNLTNVDGTTALMAAAGVGVKAVGEEPGTPEEVETVVRMLVDLGLDPNTVDKNGETAMHGAAYRNFPGTVAVLHEIGADPNIWNRKNRHGWTPLMIASGKRPGSVKPSPETIEALQRALSSRK